MARAVDERIVKMSVEDSNFKSKLESAITSLTNFTNKLSSIKGGGSFDSISSSASKSSGLLSALGTTTEGVQSKFSALQAIAVGALATIGSKAVMAGGQMVKSFTIDPITQGFDEYQSKMKAVGVVSANTGESMSTINGVLKDMNAYADKTIYSFEDMTTNLGTFTAAGVSLKTAQSSIKGISNLAATTGSSSQQASMAMYQLSQAIASGKVGLQDWNSVVNAGMGGKKFQSSLISTYKKLNNMKDPLKNANGETVSFRDSLQSGWITSDILTQTLTDFSKDKSMLKMATQAHTFKDAMSAVGEAAQSGWGRAFETLIGGYKESTKVWTGLQNMLAKYVSIIPNYIAKVAKALRTPDVNKIVPLDRITNAFSSLMDNVITPVLSAITGGFRDVFGPFKLGAGWVQKAAVAFQKWAKSLKVSGDTLVNVRTVAQGFATAIKLISSVIGAVAKAIFGFGDGLSKSFGVAISYMASMSEVFQDMVNGDIPIVAGILTLISKAIGGIGKSLGALSSKGSKGGIIAAIFSGLTFAAVYKGITTIVSAITGLTDKVVGKAVKILDQLSSSIKAIQTALSSFTSAVKYAQLALIATSILELSIALKMLSGLSTERLSKGIVAVGASMAILLGSFKTLELMDPSGIKMIAISVAIAAIAFGLIEMAGAVKLFSMIPAKDIAVGLGAIAATLGILIGALYVLGKVKVNSAQLLVTAVAMIAVGVGLNLMASAVGILGSLDIETLVKGLTTVALLLTEIALFSKVVSGLNLLVASVGILAISVAMNALGTAFLLMGSLSWTAIEKGLVTMAAALTEFYIAARLINPLQMVALGVSMLVLGLGLTQLGIGLKVISGVSWKGLAKGLATMAGALMLLVIAGRLATAGTIGLLAITAAVVGISVGIAIALPAITNFVKTMLTINTSFKNIGVGMLAIVGGFAALAAGLVLLGIVGSVASAGLMAIAIPLSIILLSTSALIYSLSLLGEVGSKAMNSILQIMTGVLTFVASSMPTIMGIIKSFLVGLVQVLGATLSELFTQLTGLLPKAFALLSALITGLLSLLTSLMPKFAAFFVTALTTILNAINTMAPAIFNTVNILLSGLLNTIIKQAPKIADAAVTLITSFISAISKALPVIINAGVKMIIAFLNGINNNIGRIVNIVTSIIVNFLNAVAKNLPSIINSGVNLAISFINGVANGIRNNKEGVNGAIRNLIGALLETAWNGITGFGDVGAHIVSGIWKGIKGGWDNLVQSFQSLASDLAAQIKKTLGIKSPSRVFAKEVGQWIPKGIAMGIDNSASSMQTALVRGIQTATDAANSILGDNLDNAPVITPVLDASNLNGSANISTNATAFTKNSPYTGKIGTVSSGVTAQLDANTISAISNGIVTASGISPADNAETNGLLRTLIATVDSSFTPDAARRAVEYSNSNRNSLKSMMMGGS